MSLQQAVTKAAQLLDKEVPGWERRVDPETLKMSSCMNCVLGQVFGPRIESKLWDILPVKVKAAVRNVMPFSNGFHKGYDYFATRRNHTFGDFAAISEACGGNPELRCLWIQEIAKRTSPGSEGSDSTEGRGANSPHDPMSAA